MYVHTWDVLHGPRGDSGYCPTLLLGWRALVTHSTLSEKQHRSGAVGELDAKPLANSINIRGSASIQKGKTTVAHRAPHISANLPSWHDGATEGKDF